MEYERLFSEYESAIANQQNVIKTYLKKLKTANKHADSKEVCRLNRILCTLYSEKNDLEQSAVQLKDYMMKQKENGTEATKIRSQENHTVM